MPEWTKEQEQVIQLRDRNILVAAAAGSGKTATLVERIIQMVTDEKAGVDIDRLLVVTFTRAAAGEMQGRIRAALDKRLQQEPDNEYLQRQAALLHNARITTIDSFCQNIVRNYFHTIQLDPVFRVADETELTLIKQDIMAELLEEKYARGEEGFLKLAESFAPGRTDRTLEKLILELYQIAMSYPWPSDWLQEAGELYCCRDLEEMESTRWMKELKEYLRQMAGAYLQMAEQARDLCRESDGPEMYLPMVQEDICQIEKILEAADYIEYGKAFAAVSPLRLSSKKGDVDPEKRERVKRLRESYMKNGVKSLQETFFYQRPEEMLRDIQGVADVVRELVQTTGEFIAAFDGKKREEGLVDFGDLEHFALDILVDRDEEGRPHPSETARELQEYYQEILTDEYQDSNYVQELILTSLCRAPEQRPYLFMVGDVKQSIYQFRLARPEIFMEKYRSYTVGRGPCQRIDLHQNFRSREMVLESANFIFARIMQEALGGIRYDQEASLAPGAHFPDTDKRIAGRTQILLAQRQTEAGEGREELMEVLDNPTLEAALIGGRIRELIQGENPLYVMEGGEYRCAEYRDIVILLRSPGKWTENFIEVLTDMGIPAYSETKTGYFSAVEIETVLNLLRIIDNPRQDIPLAAVLRSCIGGMTDEELAVLAVLPEEINYIDRLTHFCQLKEGSEEQKRLPMETEDWRELQVKAARFMDSISAYRELAQIVSVYELLQKIYQSGYYELMSAMPAGEKRAANLDMLLQQAVEFGERDQHGIFAFVRYIEGLRRSDIDFGQAAMENENADAVRVMSIHKSKGLEFPVVFVAGLGKMFNMQDIRRATLIDPDYGIGAEYLDREKRTKVPTLIKRFLANRMKRNVLAEEIRILYVALTRAKEQLILTGTVRNLDKGMEKWGAASGKPGLAELTGAQTYLDWIMPVVLNAAERERLFQIETIASEELIQRETRQIEKELQEYVGLKDFDTATCYDKEMARELKEQAEFVYPYAADQRLPVKVSVSELKRLQLLRAEQASEERSLREVAEAPEPPRPAFLQEDQGLSGAMRGTLYHLAMEHFPYEEYGQDGYGWEEYREELCRGGYLTSQQAALLDGRQFEQFLESDIGRRMKIAAQAGVLKREQQFIIGFPARELYPDIDSEELTLVQGIIDAYFPEEGGLILVDYKTDRVQSVKELAEKYRVQLQYYARALERLTGRPVKEQIIYSFALGEQIRLLPAEERDTAT